MAIRSGVIQCRPRACPRTYDQFRLQELYRFLKHQRRLDELRGQDANAQLQVGRGSRFQSFDSFGGSVDLLAAKRIKARYQDSPCHLYGSEQSRR